MNITAISPWQDVATFAVQEGFEIDQNKTTGTWTINNRCIGETCTVSTRQAVVTFFVGYNQAKSRYA